MGGTEYEGEFQVKATCVGDDVTAVGEGGIEELGDEESGTGGVMVTKGVWRAALPAMARQVVGEVEVTQLVQVLLSVQEELTEEVVEVDEGGGGMLAG